MPSYDYYEILEVDPNASVDVIQRAYRILAKRYHPDGGHGSRVMQMLNEAFEVLSDPARRDEYDASRSGRDSGTGNTSSAADLERAYVQAMKVRRANPPANPASNWSSIEWAVVPVAVWDSYVKWRGRSSFGHWLEFLSSLRDWEMHSGPAVVGAGVLATRMPKAAGLPGFSECVDPLETSDPTPNGAFPTDLTAWFAEYERLQREAAGQATRFWSEPGRAEWREFLKWARWWATADDSNSLTRSQCADALEYEYGDRLTQSQLADLREGVQL